MFQHVDIEIPKLERQTIDGVRYYDGLVFRLDHLEIIH